MRSLLAVLILLTSSLATAADEPPTPRTPRPAAVLAEGATPEIEISFIPAVFGYIPLDRGDGEHSFLFRAYVYTPDHEGFLGSHEVVVRPGQKKPFDRKLSADLRVRGTVAFTNEGILRYAAEVLVKDRIAARTSATLRTSWPIPPAALHPAPNY